MYRMLFAILIVLGLMGAGNYANLQYMKGVVMDRELRLHEQFFMAQMSATGRLLMDARNIAYFLAYDKNVLAMLQQSNRNNDYYYKVNDIKERLSTLRGGAAGIEEVLIYSMRTRLIVQSSGSIPSDLFFRNRYVGDFEQWRNVMERSHHYTVYAFHSFLDVSDIPSRYEASSVSIIHTVFDRAIPVGTIVIYLDEDYLKQAILSSDAIPDTSHVSVMFRDGKKFLTLKDESVSTMHADNPLRQPSGYWSGDTFISYQESSFGDLVFVIETPREELFEDINRHFQWINIALAGFMLLCLLLGLYIAHRIYVPICKVTALLGASGNERLTQRWNRGEMQFIEHNIQEVISVNDHLRGFMKDSIPMLIEFLFLKMVTSQQDIAELIDLAKDIGVQFKKGRYSTLVVQFDLSNKHDCTQQWLNHVRDRLSQRIVGFAAVNETLYSIILYSESKEDLPQLRGHIFSLWQEFVPSSDCRHGVRIGLGAPCDSPSGIRHSYVQALDALELQPAIFVDQPAFYVDLFHVAPAHAIMPVQTEQLLANYIRSGNQELTSQLIMDTLDHALKRKVSIGEYRRLCLLMQHVIDLTAAGGSSRSGGDRTSEAPSFHRLDASANPQHMREWLADRGKQATAFFMNQSSEFSAVERIMEYIQDHLHEDLSLERMAHKAGYSANHFSKLFKQHTNVNYSNYVNLKRLEAAKKLILNTNMKIKEISSDVGYTSINNFISTFRKYEGISPTQFKRNRVH